MNIKTSPLAILCLSLAPLTISTAAQTIEPVYSFASSSFGSPANPRGDLVLGKDGNFYGTTQHGGSGGFGTVFKVTTGGVLTVLANFDGYGNGVDPFGGVTFGPDGNLYGTTGSSGPNGAGTVFQVTTNGYLTTIYSFSRLGLSAGSYTNADGTDSKSRLTLGPDGYLYGTTSLGGVNGNGTVFKINTSGELTTLFSFSAIAGVFGTNATGASPYGGMAWGPDGSLYGTTELGGSQGDGTVFKITPDGGFTLLVNFFGRIGVAPEGTLIAGPDGCLYGTTLNGGIYGDVGTVFKVTTNGLLTTIVSLKSNAGTAPAAGVTFGPDGNLYGTTSAGTTNGIGSSGTVFRVSTNGVLTTLAGFDSTNGFDPEGGVTFGPDGNLYGTTFSGGTNEPNAAGEIFWLNVGLTVTNKLPKIAWNADGAVMLNLPSEPGSTNRLWATTNLDLPLAQWQVLATNAASTGIFQFTDTNTSGAPVKFYRLSTP